MLKYLIPRIDLADLPAMFAMAFAGAILAGIYGVLHDHITYSIGPEYYTNLKFKQFKFADFGLGDRVFVCCIGFLATWWVGFIIGWFLSRRLIPNQLLGPAFRSVFRGFAIVLTCGALAGMVGYLYGLWRGPGADYSAWLPIVTRFQITDIWAFVRVAYIHNASYLGGLIGLIISLIVVRPKPLDSSQNDGA